MKLSDIPASGSVSLDAVIADKDLAREVQGRLNLAGVLDPPIDGVFGPVSEWALGEYCRAKHLEFDAELSGEMASALLSKDIATTFPLAPGTDLAGKLISAMQRRGYWISRHPRCLNIVYVEGVNADGTANDNVRNHFNDMRFLIQVDAGECKIVDSWEGTTEPGTYWTVHPMNPQGAARIKFGQYKSWRVGIHHPNQNTAHEALVQVADVVVYRDKNKTYNREGPKFTGIFAINQHWGYDQPRNDLGRTSAGCLVGRTKDGHKQFMAGLKSDPRYTANHGYRFMAAVLPPESISETVFDPSTDH